MRISSTGIWWHCDDDNISELSDIPEGVYYKKSDKPQSKKKINGGFIKGTVCCIYQNLPFNKTHL